MARGDGDDGGGGWCRRSRPWLGEGEVAGCAALHWATLGRAGLLAVLQLQQAGVASAFASGLAPSLARTRSAHTGTSRVPGEEGSVGGAGRQEWHRNAGLARASGQWRRSHTTTAGPLISTQLRASDEGVTSETAVPRYSGTERWRADASMVAAKRGRRVSQQLGPLVVAAFQSTGSQGAREPGSQVGGKRQTGTSNNSSSNSSNSSSSTSTGTSCASHGGTGQALPCDCGQSMDA
ncbi:hypothetical protein COCMIDRAFT_28194 [Bipolaris oryzae ATCC 44560]|uniref:Uncharacterized protein n=1 Tax=Bipolaris oryzae ATCC 44560 TaxID=930090 RepID=W6ZIE8_COCMI|nr:uncharacterized protein COCMIDRAFT_28194 [Bipolaris oryzae ATCC 44560]EUC43301.1 hypothetical protein COCMIDRAFT_28194 [Bipolaris oryzae ATCC 44560]